MDQFVVLTTVPDHILADNACTVLEEAGVPVLLEHVEIVRGKERVSGVRVLVPATAVQRASVLLDHVITSARREAVHA